MYAYIAYAPSFAQLQLDPFFFFFFLFFLVKVAITILEYSIATDSLILNPRSASTVSPGNTLSYSLECFVWYVLITSSATSAIWYEANCRYLEEWHWLNTTQYHDAYGQSKSVPLIEDSWDDKKKYFKTIYDNYSTGKVLMKCHWHCLLQASLLGHLISDLSLVCI